MIVNHAPEPMAVLWLGHSAGGGIEAFDLATLSDALPAHGITVVRHEQPWRVAGRTVAPRPAVLDIGWLETAPLVAELAGGLPVVAGGRSAGARVACRTANAIGAASVVCLAFPLHPPGRPEKSRVDELLSPTTPVLVMQGDRDTFGTAQELVNATANAPGVRVIPVPGADHGMKVPASSPLRRKGVAELVTTSVVDFIRGSA